MNWKDGARQLPAKDGAENNKVSRAVNKFRKRLEFVVKEPVKPLPMAFDWFNIPEGAEMFIRFLPAEEQIRVHYKVISKVQKPLQ